ncbi:MAG: fructosamine kinase family protein [Deltaproteobacteria bacterium]|nr:fructosamine kinase family protein [Deltaproteobacteria bacterium]
MSHATASTGRTRTPTGREVFVKALDQHEAEVEARGLALMAAAGVRVPEVVDVRHGALVLAWLERGPARWEEAGRMLAALHAVTAERHGLDHDNFMGRVPQDNRPASDATFATFFRERRLEPLAHLLPAPLRRRLDALPLEDVLAEPDRPRLVHGDLWSGNLVHAADGPTFIDPSVWFGHPEVDLAMTRLFGGFPPAFEAAWREALGPAAGSLGDLDRRIDLLQLYPLLIHVRLFGGGYLADVEDRLDRLR